eukprot:SAG22_NODE_101_length_20519_cov_15.588002_30_plen_116_part_00
MLKELARIQKLQAAQDKKDAKKFGGMFDKMAAQDKKNAPPEPEPVPAPAPPAPPPPKPAPEPMDLSAEDAGEAEDDTPVPGLAACAAIFDGGDSVEAAKALTRLCKAEPENGEAW